MCRVKQLWHWSVLLLKMHQHESWSKNFFQNQDGSERDRALNRGVYRGEEMLGLTYQHPLLFCSLQRQECLRKAIELLNFDVQFSSSCSSEQAAQDQVLTCDCGREIPLEGIH